MTSTVVSSAGMVGDRWVRFDAVDASAYELARYWGERVLWPYPQFRVDVLHELAVMSRLGDWCWRWQPTVVHQAVIAGADAGEVVGATGSEARAVAARWWWWAQGQRRLFDSQPVSGRAIGVNREEFERVAAVLQRGWQ